MSSEVVLSRKQQKSQAFKAKQRAKKRGEAEPEDVPEEDLIDEEEEEDEQVVTSEDSKKLKGKAKEQNGVETKVKSQAEEPRKKRKIKTAWDEDDVADGEETKKGKKDIKQRFILFIGASQAPLDRL